MDNYRIDNEQEIQAGKIVSKLKLGSRELN